MRAARIATSSRLTPRPAPPAPDPPDLVGPPALGTAVASSRPIRFGRFPVKFGTFPAGRQNGSVTDPSHPVHERRPRRVQVASDPAELVDRGAKWSTVALDGAGTETAGGGGGCSSVPTRRGWTTKAGCSCRPSSVTSW